MGAGSIVGRDVFVDDGVTIGAGVQIHHRALLYRDLVIEDGVLVGPGAILTNDRAPRAIVGTPALQPPAEDDDTPTTIRRGASIGPGAVVVSGTQVGPFAMIAPGAVVTRDVPGHALVAGNPAERLGWMCACGARLVDAGGHAAPAERERYAMDQGLTCPSCGRVYTYVPDGETLRESAAAPGRRTPD